MTENAKHSTHPESTNGDRPEPASGRTRRRFITLLGAAAVLALSVGVAGAAAQDRQQELADAKSKLDDATAHRGVLTSEIEQFSSQISDLVGQVAVLRNREDEVAAELADKQAEFDQAQKELIELRDRLAYAVKRLSDRLVAIYKSTAPDELTLILESDGFEQMLNRATYLEAIENQDADLVDQVRTLRDSTRETVEKIRVARDTIAAKKEELTRTRTQLEARQAELDAARADRQASLDSVNSNIDHLEGDISDIEADIQADLAAAAAAQASSGGPPATLPAGPVVAGSGDMIWPVDGPVTSPFGWRWGRMHEGIDIGVPSGTPIRAAKAGTIALASVYGGYGNYTCINHGGGLSTCYAHQSSFAITSGAVNQGDIVGYSGCTGNCFGDHLHFEVRVNGAAVDPMGYL